MIVLDTNVISELMKPEPERRVFDWLAAQTPAEVYTTALCQAEILFGLAILPPGRRRRQLEGRADTMFRTLFAGRVLAFDSQAAPAYAEVAAKRQAAGRRIEEPDAMIAAIARLYGAALATRNLRDFEGCGIALIDPWSAG